MKKKTKLIDGWKIKNWLDWLIAMVSFVLFLLLEGAIIYSYFVFLRQHGW